MIFAFFLDNQPENGDDPAKQSKKKGEPETKGEQTRKKTGKSNVTVLDA